LIGLKQWLENLYIKELNGFFNRRSFPTIISIANLVIWACFLSHKVFFKGISKFSFIPIVKNELIGLKQWLENLYIKELNGLFSRRSFPATISIANLIILACLLSHKVF
jgi:hypothetical protein